MNAFQSPIARTAPDAGPATATPVVALRGISKTYYRGDLAVQVLHDIDLDIRPGEFLALMGTSGSGKSTLMNLIGLLDRPTSGSYSFAGRDVTALDSDQRADLRREAFGFIFQQYNLLPTATAVENVEVPAIYAGLSRAQRAARATELLTQLGMGDRLDHRPNQLSGGQQQRVSIARALMNGGMLILADEPTGALDSRSGADVMQLLRDLNARGHTIVLITHDPDVAQQARRIVEIRDGHILSDRPTANAGPAPATTIAAPVARPGSLLRAMDVLESARMAVGALGANLMRTLLTLLGIIIGVASVVAMLAIGDGARKAVLDRISSMGTNLLLIRPGAPNIRPVGGITATLVAPDADALAVLPNVMAAVPEYPGNATVRRGNRDYATQINATTPNFTVARDWPVARGTFLTDEDNRTYAAVAVVGQTVANVMFPPDVDPLGQYLLVNNIPFRVIGIMSPKGASPFGSDLDDVVFVPLTTGTLRLFGQRYVRTITVAVQDLTRIDETQEEIRRVLTARHKAEDFQIRNMASIIETATATQNTLTLLLGSIAAISLLVGGIGVMNIMLVSVTERTREIGIRMATGARKLNIMLQFNGEALAVCTLGGVIGVLLGLATIWTFAWFGRPVIYSAGPVLLAFGCAFATGIVFGYLPARKAANLDPVVALGAE